MHWPEPTFTSKNNNKRGEGDPFGAWFDWLEKSAWDGRAAIGWWVDTFFRRRT